VLHDGIVRYVASTLSSGEWCLWAGEDFLDTLMSVKQRPFSYTSLIIPGACLLLGGAVGWFARQPYFVNRDPVTGQQLRIDGYRFISPLIACDSPSDRSSASLSKLEKTLEAQIAEYQTKGDISSASVFIRRLKTGEQISINGAEKFFPASLKKVPVMMSFFRLAQDRPQLLQTRGVLQGTVDYNQDVEIKPDEAPEYGKEYSIEELIAAMIVHSDNNGYQVLAANLGEEGQRGIYEELNLSYPNDALEITDFMTAPQFALFFRSLYNASYLSETYSERALELMSNSAYKNGIRAGVPEAVTVANKFGVLTITKDGSLNQRELHDCGIVYANGEPYILCIMTKSTNALSEVEKAIAEISQSVYKAATTGW
jgi:beta-lactamase class A